MKKKLFLFSILLVFSVILAACSGGDDSSSDDSSNDDQAQEDNSGDSNDNQDEGSGEMADEQVFTANISSEPFSLNPGLANDSTSGNVLLQSFEGLTRMDKNGEPQPAMASDIQVSDDQKTYTFTIREDAKWSNGDPVTAQDFEYAWKWALDPNNQSQYAYQLYPIKGAEDFNSGNPDTDDLDALKDAVAITAEDDQTLKVELNNPTPYFLQLTAFYTYFPVNQEIAEANPEWYADAGENYVSNGPFKMTEWGHNEKIVLEKNDQYWDKDNVNLEKIEFAMINDQNSSLSSFQNGEFDWTGSPFNSLPPEAIPSLKDEGTLNIEPIAGTYWYKFNTEKEPFNNVNIRKAFAYAIDRAGIVKSITKGEEIPAMAAVPPTMFESNEEGYFDALNVEKAKEHLEKGLEELGYDSVEDLPTIELSYNTQETHAKIAQAIQDMWKKNLGIDVTLNNNEWAVYIETLHQGNYQIGRMGWLGDFNDPINFLELYKEKGGNNDTRWHSEEYASLLEDSQTETDSDKRLEMLKEAEGILMDEMPIAPIYFYTNKWVQDENLKDVMMSGLGDVQLKWAYFEAE
ncbi:MULTISPECIES: peptide ABC transporter substrate-binding protein [Pontibacillus]|uniref:Peptide ABC transporter substrate-binding protein n=1 Tax=Pontibacillus chungwhensis TaxID=265426 RepID=A0ABY8V059_9BACI|nr:MULTISPECIES: peptide ABC transporter substrate-binding protein [Pontibacillus]MCD5324688.1 peptide ABC transporter substrate-binding protein [Pontibacillus sp. HN14]WIF99018.1 peptide ABC transporter substrate-binding protein [Pontibacillus chungwhensis]